MRIKTKKILTAAVVLSVLAAAGGLMLQERRTGAAEKAPFYFQKSFRIEHQYSTPLMGSGKIWAKTTAHKMIHRESGKAMYCVYPGHASGSDSNYEATKKAVGMYAELNKANKILCSKYAYVGEEWGAAGNSRRSHVVYMAVQGLIWDVIRTGAKSPYKNTVRRYDSEVSDMMNKVKKEAAGLTDTSLKFGPVLGSASASAAKKKVMGLGETGSKTFTVEQGDFSLYEYISVNGGKVQSFKEGETVKAGNASFTHEKGKLGVTIPSADKDIYVIKLMKTQNEKNKKNVEEFLAATDGTNQPYQLPAQFGDAGPQFFAFKVSPIPTDPIVPKFQIDAVKLDAEGGFDGSVSTPQGDGSLNVTFDASGTVSGGKPVYRIEPASSVAAHWGTGVSFIVQPWNSIADLSFSETELTQTYSGAAEIEIRETVPGTGYLTETEGGTGTDVRTYSISYSVSRSRAAEDDPWPSEYTYRFNGRTLTDFDEETVLTPEETGIADAVFRDQVKTGDLQIVKTKEDLDPFSRNGEGVRDYSTASLWTLQLISGGSEENQYVKVKEADNAANPFFRCYEVMRDGSGTPADEEHPLSTGEFGQILISGLPYGEYLVTEIKADTEGYVLEYFIVTIAEEGEKISTAVNNVPKENKVTVVKKDAETGKTIPAAGIAFRIRYMGNPSGPDPALSPNYGRLLPNGSNYTDGYQYVFYTDKNGRIHLPYALEYGHYQLEEFLAPEGYYIGSYDESGESSSADGTLGFYDTVAIYDKEGNKVDYRESDSGITYNYYAFSVTEQKKDETVKLTVNMTNNAVKGKIQIVKTGETLTGFRDKTIAGHTVKEPVYEQRPLKGAKFQILALEDVELRDGTIPPVPYDAGSGREILYETVTRDHYLRPDSREEKKAETSGDSKLWFRRTKSGREENLAETIYQTGSGTPARYNLSGDYPIETVWKDTERNEILYNRLHYRIQAEIEYAGAGLMKTKLTVEQRNHADSPSSYPMWMRSHQDYLLPMSKMPGLLTLFSTDGDRLELKEESYSDGNSVEIQNLEEIIYRDAAVVEKRNLTWLKPEFAGNPMLKTSLNWSDGAGNYGHIDQLGTNRLLQGGTIEALSFLPYCEVEKDGIHYVAVPDDSSSDEYSWKPFTPGDSDLLEQARQFASRKLRLSTENITNLPDLPEGYACADSYYGGENAVSLSVDNGTERRYVLIEQTTGEAVLLSDSIEDPDSHYDPAYYLRDHKGSTSSYWPMTADSVFQLDHTPASYPDGFTPVKQEDKYLCTDGNGSYMVYAYGMDAPEGYQTNTAERFRMFWVRSDAQGEFYQAVERKAEIILTQSISSENGWIVCLPDLYREEGNDMLTPLPYEFLRIQADPEKGTAAAVCTQLDSPQNLAVNTLFGYGVAGTNCENEFGFVYGRPGEQIGNKNTFTFREPEETEYFLLQDGTRIGSVYSGGMVKTEIRLTADAEMPALLYQGQEIDWLNGVDPDHPVRKEEFGGGRSYFITSYSPDGLKGKECYTLMLGTRETEYENTFNLQFADGTELKEILSEDPESKKQTGLLRLAGIYRTMRYPQGSPAETITSGEDGIAASSELPLGKYYIQEIQAPSGYTLSKDPYFFELEYKDQYTPLVWVSSEQKNPLVNVDLELYKVFQTEEGSESYVPKAGAVFGIFAGEELAPEAPAGTMMAAVTTGEDGRIQESLKLPKGSYYAREIAAPAGYQLNDQKFYFMADDGTETKALAFGYETDGILGTIVHEGKGMASVRIDTLTRIPSISMRVNGITYDTTQELEEKTIGNDVFVANRIQEDRSVFTITGSLYEPVEIEFENGAKMTVVIGEQSYQAVFTDGPEAAVSLNTGEATGVTAETKEKVTTVMYRQEAAFTGYEVIGETSYRAPSTRLISGSGITAEYVYAEESGVKKAKITYPRSIKEETVLFDGDPVPFTGTEWDRQTGMLLVDLSKFTRDASLTLGAENVLFQRGTDGSGKAFYTIGLTGTEVKASEPEGYQKDGLFAESMPDGKCLIQQNREIQIHSPYGRAKAAAVLQHDHSFAAVRTEGMITSVWYNGAAEDPADFQSFTLLPGNTAVLAFSDGSVLTVGLRPDKTLLTKAEGILNGSFTEGEDAPGLLLNGSADQLKDELRQRIFQEFPMDAVTIDGIHLRTNRSITMARSDSSVSRIQVMLNAKADANGEIKPGEIKNDVSEEPDRPHVPDKGQTELRISKVNTKGETVPGAALLLADGTGSCVKKWISGREPEVITGLEPGKYLLSELTAPEGYKTAEPVEITVDEKTEVQWIRMVDEEIMGRIRVIKTDPRGTRLEGAVFRLRRLEDGTVVDILTTDQKGEAVSCYLPVYTYDQGEKTGLTGYELIEMKAPRGYRGDFVTRKIYFDRIEEEKAEDPVLTVTVINEPAGTEMELPETGRRETAVPAGGLLFSVLCILYLGCRRHTGGHRRREEG